MPKHKRSVWGDKTLRDFYEACGIAPHIIENAIRIRYEESTNFVGQQRAAEAARLARKRKRISTEDTET
jgi:hypothetical protein